MPKFFNKDIAELAHQLTLSPRRLRAGQILEIDRLTGIVEAEKAYPYEFVCHAITKYHKRGSKTSASIPGKALVSDLVTMAELISRQANLAINEIQGTFCTQQEVADRLKVSTKTVRRWRDRGLMGIRVVFADGVNRLAFLKSTIDRFIDRNQSMVDRGASFKQLTDDERQGIVSKAKALVDREPIRLHAAAKLIAAQTGRAVETIRYTLRRYDESHESSAIFIDKPGQLCSDSDLAIWKCKEAGEQADCIASAFDLSIKEVQRVWRRVQLKRWANQPPEYMHNELFDAPKARTLILDGPEPVGEQVKSPRVPKDLPAYLQTLYLTPLLSREQEQDLFRRYNFVKYQAATLLKQVDLEVAAFEPFEDVRDLLLQAEQLSKRIVQANLRLVVSIAKRHLRPTDNLFELVSDGNVSLMRAVEKFNYALGNKFSTYATWAIIKNYARSSMSRSAQGVRLVTGQEVLLEIVPDQQNTETLKSDREAVRDSIVEGLKSLSDREREIVSQHFGLGQAGHTLTLEQLGSQFGVTKERVRQIEKRAIAKLRSVLSPSLAETLPE